MDRECVRCGFSGPHEVEQAVGLDLFGEPVLCSPDEAPPVSVVVCGGCARDMRRLGPEGFASAARSYLGLDAMRATFAKQADRWPTGF